MMQITQGCAGRCYRKKCIIVQEDVQDFVATMKDLGFEEAEAKQFNIDRKNYACIPVMDTQDNVLAVLSLDAREPNVYDARRVEIAEKFTPFFARLLTIEETVEE
jgi:putative methionine-R-sulfoxide reductase with GAF domain